MGTIAITGAASGIGLATRRRLEADGHRVVGVDLRDAEVVADLSTDAGREAMVAGVTEASGGVLDGLLAGAGVGGTDGRLVVSVNYFGAVASLDGLRPLLARGTNPAAVAISSNSVTTQPGVPLAVAEACAAGDEAAARAAGGDDGVSAYPATKLALAHWVRRRAVSEDWIGSGIRLNAIAPGFIDTPMTEDAKGFILSLGDVYPIPAQRAGTPAEVAALIAYLLGPEAGFFCGSVVFMDGGTDAALRPTDWPTPRS
ncbi:MAG: SDR family oxidoreductase [Acidimicrobiales bacterium]|jgi:NAD(P)-dependent dehydrogenase (short-subunit alcohol dehydrogenase family)|nr:SDR family oxidoreductase [Acidimicrobiales bacterium]